MSRASMSGLATVVQVTMPQLGETVAEGTVTRWLKQVGETVADQEPLLEIATDKVDTELPAPVAGVVLEILVAEDVTVPVGTLLATIDTAPGGSAALNAAPARNTPPKIAAHSVHHRHTHSPRVRKTARTLGVDLRGVTGTGPLGRVVKGDVERAARTLEHDAAPVATTLPALPPAPRPAAVPARTQGQPPPAVATALIEIDVTHLLSGDDPVGRLLASAAAGLMRALRQHGVANATAMPVLEVDGRVIDRGADLTVQALASAIAQDTAPAHHAPANQPEAEPRTPRVSIQSASSKGLLLHIPPLPPGFLCALGVGSVVERPVAVRVPGRDPLIGVGSLVLVSFSHETASMDSATAAACLTTLARRMADPDPARDSATTASSG